ncbi:O-acetylserine/cysteine exporter [soil metagenome]
MMPPGPRGEHLTLLAFFGIIVCGGSNAVAIRLGNVELAPFWAASLRFGLAALILLAIMLIGRTPLPRGRARLGVVLYGLTAFAGSYAGAYWGLVEAPAATAMVVIATVPLMTLLIAVAIGQEGLTGRGLAGAVVALVGIVILVGDQIGAAVPLTSLAALFGGACFIAVSGVLVKQVPPGHPVAANALGMLIGALCLGALSAVAGEPRSIPAELPTWASLIYLVLVGSVGLFMLVLYVLARWSASATSYATLVMPLVTISGAALLLGETVEPLFLVGSAFVLAGVYIGISADRPGFLGRRAPVPVPPSQDARSPGC